MTLWDESEQHQARATAIYGAMIAAQTMEFVRAGKAPSLDDMRYFSQQAQTLVEQWSAANPIGFAHGQHVVYGGRDPR